MKNACASESCPVTPTSSVSPMAPIAAAMVNRPVASQKPWAYWGSHSRKPASTIQAMIAFLDTAHLPRPKQPRGPPQQDHEQHRVWHDVRQPPAEERDLVLVAGRHRLSDTDQQPADDRAGGRVQAAEDRDRDGAEREQPGRVGDAAGREADKERASDRGEPAGNRPRAC